MFKFKQYLKLNYFLAIVIALGIFFRFANIDKKVYWYDETVTSIRLSGYTKEDFSDLVSNGQVIKIADLQKYQQPDPKKGLIDTIRSLAVENPEHPPLYFMLARLWAQGFGYSSGSIRSFSAAVSLLAFPLIYWLCRELFELPLMGWMAIALLSISPLQVLYAQEARGYSLWTVTILLSSAALLRAMGLNNSRNWALYTLTLVLALYTNLLTVLIAIAHGIYVFMMKNFRFTPYFISSLSAFIVFFPWCFLMVTNFNDIDWVKNEIPLPTLVSRWLLNFSAIFFDAAIGYSDKFIDIKSGYDSFHINFSNPLSYAIIPVLVIILYAIYFLVKSSKKQVWLFIIILMVVPTIPLLLKDLIYGGQRSSIPRYLIPCYLAIQLAVAYLLSNKIAANILWRIIAVVIIYGGVVSCAISSQSETWWNKYSSYYNPPVARIINQKNQPLVIGSNAIRVTSLSYLLNPKVKLMLVKEPNVPKIPGKFSDLFLFRPAKTLKSGLEQQNYKVEIVHEQGDLWRMKKK
jgi:uncharacterized membrane protein